MNELTTIQAVLYGVSGLLLYAIGFVAGQMWTEWRREHPKQKRNNRRKKNHPDELGFDPMNPMNHNFRTYHWQIKDAW